MNARGIPRAPHYRPGIGQWEGRGVGGRGRRKGGDGKGGTPIPAGGQWKGRTGTLSMFTN